MPLDRVVPAEGTQIAGTYIPPGTTVGMSTWCANRSKKVFGEDALEFRPERWLEADEDQLRVMERTFLTVSVCLFSHSDWKVAPFVL